MGWRRGELEGFPVLFIEGCFFNRAELKGWTGHCCKENNKIEIKLLGSYRNGTQFGGNFFLTPKQKGWLNLGIYWPVSWYQILIPSGLHCHGVERTGLLGNKSFCIHACDWSYMKGILQTGNMKIPRLTWMLVIWHLHLHFCSARESLCQAHHWHLQRWKKVST